ncbi:NAD(P)-dependent oxidoreductase [Candidatus Daviesbacteria bacterium]|nr:NAD(P)-dependent oxidoreductase [Candidatus Daviesbacteria bacterium]
MERILVTGGSGILGRYLVTALSQNKDFQIVATYNTNPSSVPRGENIIRVQADLSDPKKALAVMEGVDYCFHLATKVNLLGSRDQGGVYFENLAIHQNVLQAASDQEVRRFFYLSSFGLFSAGSARPVIKGLAFETMYVPTEGYLASKLAAEQLVWFYHKEKGLPFSLIRIFAIPYGFVQEIYDTNKFITTPTRAIRDTVLSRSPLTLPEVGKKPFSILHLRDCAAILKACLVEATENQIVNIPPQELVTLPELIKMTQKISGTKTPEVIWNPQMKMLSTDFIVADSSANLINWQQRVRLMDGVSELARTIKQQSQ